MNTMRNLKKLLKSFEKQMEAAAIAEMRVDHARQAILGGGRESLERADAESRAREALGEARPESRPKVKTGWTVLPGGKLAGS
jgi:hypothetical protein